MVCFAISAIWKHLLMQNRIIDDINNISSIMRKFTAKTKCKIVSSDFLKLLLSKGLLAQIQCILEVYIGIYLFSIEKTEDLIRWIFYSCTMQLVGAILNAFFVFMISIEQVFKLCTNQLNAIMGKLNEKLSKNYRSSNVNVFCEISDEIDEVMVLWKETYIVYTRVQEMFNFQNFVLLLGTYCNTVLQLYHSFVIYQSKSTESLTHSLYQELLFGTCAFGEMILFVYAASSAWETSRNVIDYFEQILTLPAIDERLAQNVQGHMMNSLLQVSKVTIYKMVDLDRQTMPFLVTATILYLTLLIQFHKTH
ncbi:unnamed protein product [Hermetia illucens]|uniref:Gustatory receptor n=2 Tax=Hermetia illucens TaxID=343691 RepID=A0A7R8Z2J9_HERIL|nr:unnamed protein product [Hermetia illucens]